MLVDVGVVALLLSVANLAISAVVLGKVFFSTHKVQFMPMEEYAQLRQNLGAPPIDEPVSKAVDELFGDFDDERITDPRVRQENEDAL